MMETQEETRSWREAWRRDEESGGLCVGRQAFEWEVEMKLYKKGGIMERSMVQKM